MDLRDLFLKAQGILVMAAARAGQGVCLNCAEVPVPDSVEEGTPWVCPGCGARMRGEVRDAIGGAVLGGGGWLIQRRPPPPTRGGGRRKA